MTTLEIDGSAMSGIAGFYDEVNRVFMRGETWTLGPGLDALDDMLHGGYGVLAALRDEFPVRLVWRDHDAARRALGKEATREYLREKLRRPDVYDVDLAERQLRALDDGTGATYFDLVVQVFDDHRRTVTLEPA